MEIRDDTALAERTQHREASARHVGLRELPDVPMGPEPTTVPGDLPDRLRRAADQAQSRSGEWRLIHWLEDFPLAAFGQSAAAVSVGLALTFQSGILVGWALPILAVFGIGCIFLGGPQLCRELGRPAWLFRLVLALPGAELFSLTPVQDDVLCRAGRRRGKTSLEFYLAISVTALGGGCLAALALSSGVALVWLGLLGVGLAVLAMNRMVPTAGSWVVQTMAGLGMHVAGVAGPVRGRRGNAWRQGRGGRSAAGTPGRGFRVADLFSRPGAGPQAGPMDRGDAIRRARGALLGGRHRPGSVHPGYLLGTGQCVAGRTLAARDASAGRVRPSAT